MKLVDIKKLKVTELRCRLKELGLDSRGLKAELVERLWSASEAGLSLEPRTQDLEEGSRDSHTPAPPPEAADVPLLPTGAGVRSPCETEPGRERTDSATQTDTVPGPEAAPQPASEAAPAAEEEGKTGGERGRAFYEFKEEIRYKRAKFPAAAAAAAGERAEAGEQQAEGKVSLDPHGCHLHFEVDPEGSCGQPRFWACFPLLWSGCRLTHGVRRGRVGFEVRLERKLLSAELEENDVREHYGLRVGWSVADSSLMLGEDELSFSYDGRGKKVSAGREEEFGEPLSEGDIIGCYASFSKDGAVELSFYKNGRFLGVGFSLNTSVLQGRCLFPHILCKSCLVRLHLDPVAPPWYPGPPGFTPVAALPAEERVSSRPAPSSRAHSEVVLLVGLPGSGKSFWAKSHMRQHPEKQFKLLGTEELLACMISGGQRDRKLQQASKCLTVLIQVAAETPGNYILDQCNVLFSARLHKLQLFAGFRRQVVVVFPSADEWKRRLLQHQLSNGERIPETALLKLQVSCVLPEHQAELLEELQYVELSQDRAQKLLQEFKVEARRLLPPIPKVEKKAWPYMKRAHTLGPPPQQRNKRLGLHGWNNSRGNMQLWSQQQRHWSTTQQDQSCYGSHW